MRGIGHPPATWQMLPLWPMLTAALLQDRIKTSVAIVHNAVLYSEVYTLDDWQQPLTNLCRRLNERHLAGLNSLNRKHRKS